jgi:4-amino-4-deoxy-L-arabinose transferase-like glycosyltransferase
VWLPLVGLSAIAVRGLAVHHTRSYAPRHDDHAYLMHAVALVQTHAYPVFHHHGHDLPTAYRAPGFPAMLAATHVLLGDDLSSARLVQVLVGAAIVVLVGVLALQVWGPRTALVAAALAAVSPALVVFNASLISEPLFTALVLGALACALHARHRGGRITWAAAAGALAGAAALTRPEGLAIAVGVALCVGRPRRAQAVALLATVACVAPWTIRNAIVLHTFVPVSTETGNTLAGTYNSQSLGDARWRDPRLSHLYPAERAAHRDDEAGTDKALLGAAVRFAGNHPLYPLKVAATNAGRLAGVAPTHFSRWSLYTVSLPTSSAPLLRLGLLITTLLGLAGACTAAARGAPRGWWLAGAVILLTSLFVNAEQRFAVPLQPFLLLLAPLPFTRGR